MRNWFQTLKLAVNTSLCKRWCVACQVVGMAAGSNRTTLRAAAGPRVAKQDRS
jgi:hypothetical protein